MSNFNSDEITITLLEKITESPQRYNSHLVRAAHHRLARVLTQLDRFDEAHAEYREAIHERSHFNSQPDEISIACQLELAVLFFHRGQIGHAIQEFRDLAVRIGPICYMDQNSPARQALVALRNIVPPEVYHSWIPHRMDQLIWFGLIRSLTGQGVPAWLSRMPLRMGKDALTVIIVAVFVRHLMK
jgi:hypothetical protein